MRFRTCSYENELSQALRDGHWPKGCGQELRAHVDACCRCNDLVLVTQIFQQARSESEHAADDNSPSLLWWRAQLRRRNAAADRISRPITIAQAFAWFITVLVAVVFVASQYRHGLHWATWRSEFIPSRILHQLLLAGTGQINLNPFLLTSGFAVLALLTAFVVYLAWEKP